MFFSFMLNWKTSNCSVFYKLLEFFIECCSKSKINITVVFKNISELFRLINFAVWEIDFFKNASEFRRNIPTKFLRSQTLGFRFEM